MIDDQEPERSYDFLQQCRGIVHVGAGDGVERDAYRDLDLFVVWIEPLPDVVHALRLALLDYPKQTAYEGLITEHDDEECTLHVSNYNGKCSSLLPLARHVDIWPDVVYERDFKLIGISLPSFRPVPTGEYDALILDTQGTELQILRGAAPILRSFAFIQVEAADFEGYTGGTRIEPLKAFLELFGFREIERHKFCGKPEIGYFYNLIFQRIDE
jgi:hypothetical protein